MGNTHFFRRSTFNNPIPIHRNHGEKNRSNISFRNWVIISDQGIVSSLEEFRNYIEIIEKENSLLFDFKDSVMHYDAYAFAKNPRKPTIVSRKPGAVLGQRKGFSEVKLASRFAQRSTDQYTIYLRLSHCACRLIRRN